MKKNEPAFPQQETQTAGSMSVTKVAEPGLSKREHFASLLLPGCLDKAYELEKLEMEQSNQKGGAYDAHKAGADLVRLGCRMAVEAADALLEELSR